MLSLREYITEARANGKAIGHFNISTLDGWWAQAYDGDNGFAIGRGGEHSSLDYQDQTDVQTLYSVLENEVVPLFYDRDPDGIPRGWIARQKHALRTLPWRFSARRMVVDYALGCYLPAVGGLTSSLRIDVRLLSDDLGRAHAGRSLPHRIAPGGGQRKSFLTFPAPDAHRRRTLSLPSLDIPCPDKSTA